MAFFGSCQVLSGVIGLFGRITSCNILYLTKTFVTIIFSNISFFYGIPFYISLLYHIPTLCGAWYLATRSTLLKILIPSLCILLFNLHPIGTNANLYSFYWVIPIMIALIPSKSIFIQCLGSTFTTHAVGSVIWIYTRSSGVTIWHSLIPVVWAERLLFAILMTTFYYVIIYGKKYIKIKFPQTAEKLPNFIS